MDNLYKKNCNTGQKTPIYPITILDNVKDFETNKPLPSILEQYNHIYLPFKGNSKAFTRQQIPPKLRRRGLWITYVSCKGKITTEWYTSDVYTDTEWGSNSNWKSYNNTELIAELVEEGIKKALDDKVDKVDGKGLSTNDFTNDLKKKLEELNPFTLEEINEILT